MVSPSVHSTVISVSVSLSASVVQYVGGHNCVRFVIISDFYWSLFLKCYNQNFEYFFQIVPVETDIIS